jgi:Ser/Thr protein kinase RdoA (MazF antagonist)
VAELPESAAQGGGGGPGPPGPALRAAIAHRFRTVLDPGSITAIRAGDEAAVWRAGTAQGAVVVRLGPAWRTSAEVAWVHELLAFVAGQVPEAVAPLAAPDGATVLWWRGQPVALFPWVDGTPLDREDAGLRAAAAGLLARVHAALRRRPAARQRPPAGPEAPARWPRPPDPPELDDPALDAWQAAWAASPERASAVQPLHGDFYRRNLLCRAGGVVGLLDWDDAHWGAPVEEVAWAAWELAKVAAGTRLDPERARAFLAAYDAAGGTLPAGAGALAVPLIRWRLREQVRAARAAGARGAPSADDAAYTAGQVRAFSNLAGLKLR